MLVPEYYKGYVNQIKEGSVVDNLMSSGDAFSELIQTIPEDSGAYAYQEGKWTIKELVQHVNDAERVFAYRALRFARNDKTELAGFDQDLYTPESRANDRRLNSLLNEFHILRASSIDLFSNLNNECLARTGVASGGEFSVEAIGYIISGHCLHHLTIIKEKYLNS